MVPAGHSAQSLKWKDNTLFKVENCSNFLNNSVLTATQTPTDVQEAGKTTVCTTLWTMVASALILIIHTELMTVPALPTGTVRLVLKK